MSTSNPITAARIRFMWHCATVVANDLHAELEQAGAGDSTKLEESFSAMAEVYSRLELLALSVGAELLARPDSFTGFMPIDRNIEQLTREILSIAELRPDPVVDAILPRVEQEIGQFNRRFSAHS